MYKYLTIPLIIIILIIFRQFLRNSSKNLEKKDQQLPHHVIINPSSYKIVGIIWLVFTLIGFLLILFFGENKVESLIVCIMVGFPLIIGSMFFLLYSINWKIEILSNTMEYTNLFGIKRKFNLEELEIKFGNSYYQIYQGQKYITTVYYMQKDLMFLPKLISKIKEYKS